MTSDRQHQITELYHAALGHDVRQRASFLHEACGGDDALRQEVESLLGYEDAAAPFLERPAIEEAAPLLANRPESSASLAGRRIGVYQIEARIGAGGMGEVYRARDTKLGRDVAIKVLPPHLVADPERRARFEREARLLATLNHSNIAQIYGFEESSGISALVMELVEGPTLADLIAARGHVGPAAVGTSHRAELRQRVEGAPHRRTAPAAAVPSESPSRGTAARGGGAPRAIDIDDALRIARQVADALDAAHEKGITHRDLKPGNIMLQGAWGPKHLRGKTTGSRLLDPLRVEGDIVVKVLDFGLAKATAGDAPGPDLLQMPTFTAEATREGLVLGTPAYMSPEQARGWPVDKRTDIWAFGCVLFEMLTGRRTFTRETTSDTLAAVLTADPDWSLLPAGVPARLRVLLGDCLARDPKQRLRDIGDARITIDRLLGAAPDDLASVAAPFARPAPFWRRAVPWAVAALATAVAGALLVLWPPSPVPMRLETLLGADVSLALTNEATAAMPSPDGTILVFLAKDGSGPPRIYVRKLDQLQATPLSGTEDATNPFLSPDGQWIGFVAAGALKKIRVDGGEPITLVTHTGGVRGAWWSDDDTIIFQPSGVGGSLQRVSSSGGNLPPISGDELTARWPQVLPGGKTLLYTAHSSLTNFESATLVVRSLPDGPPKTVLRGGYHGRYVPSGHLIYMHEGTLFARPFDLTQLDFNGPPVPVQKEIRTSWGNGGAQFAFSASGTLVYLPGAVVAGLDGPVDWMDRTGKLAPLSEPATSWMFPRFDAHGRKLAMMIASGKQSDLWVYDLAQNKPDRLTHDAGDHVAPVWSPGDVGLVFASDHAHPGVTNLYWQRADGTGDPHRITASPRNQIAWSWYGQFLAITEGTRGTGPGDIVILSMEGNDQSGWKAGPAERFLAGGNSPMFSPDGRWIAYTADGDVFVSPFHRTGGQWKISTDGGSYPVWSRTRNELLYGTPRNTMMVVRYSEEGDAFKSGTPTPWSPTSYRPAGAAWAFDLHRDGERLVMKPVAETIEEKHDKVVLFLNFFDELRRIAPPTKR